VPDSIDSLQRTLTLLQAQSPPDANLAKQQRLLASICTVLSGWAQEDGRPAVAARLFSQAVTAWEQVVLLLAPEDAEARNELANSLYDLGAHHRDAGRTDRMETLWRQAVTVSEPIADVRPEYAGNLGRLYYNLGVAASRQGKRDQVIDWQTRAIQTLTPLCERAPGDKENRWFLGEAHVGRGQAWTDKKEPAKALPDLERAAGLADRARRNEIRLFGLAFVRADLGDPEGAAAEAEAVLGAGTPKGDVLQGAARVYGRCAGVVRGSDRVAPGRREELRERYARRAVELLRRARAAGVWRGAAGARELRADQNFAPLRGDGPFQALLREMDPGGG
jgi:tetratricopeptide (TPR) repeat protein